MPYYAPEELVYAAGMMPFGMWGSNNKTEQRSKEYCATFYCTIAQLDLEMLLDGTMDLLDGVITPTICDTLRPMSQNIRVAMSEKLPCIFLAHPQHRKPAFILRRTYNGECGIVYQLKRIPSAVARVVLRGDNVAFVAAFGKAVCVAVNHAAHAIHYWKKAFAKLSYSHSIRSCSNDLLYLNYT